MSLIIDKAGLDDLGGLSNLNDFVTEWGSRSLWRSHGVESWIAECPAPVAAGLSESFCSVDTKAPGRMSGQWGKHSGIFNRRLQGDKLEQQQVRWKAWQTKLSDMVSSAEIPAGHLLPGSPRPVSGTHTLQFPRRPHCSPQSLGDFTGSGSP